MSKIISLISTQFKSALALYLVNFPKIIILQTLLVAIMTIPPYLVLDLAMSISAEIQQTQPQPTSLQLIISNSQITAQEFTLPFLLLLISFILSPFLILFLYKIIIPRKTTKISIKNILIMLFSGFLISLVSSATSALVSMLQPPYAQIVNTIPSLFFIIISLFVAANVSSGSPGVFTPLLNSIKSPFLNPSNFLALYATLFAFFILISLPIALGLFYSLDSMVIWIIILFITLLITPLLHTSIAIYFISQRDMVHKALID